MTWEFIKPKTVWRPRAGPDLTLAAAAIAGSAKTSAYGEAVSNAIQDKLSTIRADAVGNRW